MPLLISSRMTSAGLTDSSSPSSLTVIVPGSSIAPRSRGSRTWTCDGTPLPSLRGGLRGPRRPRVPLLLRATGSSFVRFHRPCLERCSQLGWERALQRPAEGAPGNSCRPALALTAEVRSPAGEAAGLVDHDPSIGRPHDPQQLALGPRRPADHARAARYAPGRPRLSGPRYDDTSPVPAAALAVRFFLGAATPSVPSARSAPS